VPSASSPLTTPRIVALLLRALATLVLAACWHSLIVFASFPIGGADFHWVFHRPGGGDAEAACVVASVYAISGLGLALFLGSTSRRRGVSIVVGMILAAAIFSLTMVVWSPDPEDLFVIPMTGGLLAAVAWLLWRVGRVLPSPARVLLAALPGTWSLWEMYSFPYANSPSFRGAVLPLVVLYSIAFAIASFASWWRQRRGTRVTATS
jgi:hypothetical protein